MEGYRPYFFAVHNRLKTLYCEAMKPAAPEEKSKDILFYISVLKDLKKAGGLSTTIEINLHMDIENILAVVDLPRNCTKVQDEVHSDMIGLKSFFGATIGVRKKASFV
jgi:hypothetical protein